MSSGKATREEVDAAIAHGCAHFDHHGPEFRDNTFEIYKRLRETDPVHFTDAHHGYWVLTRYDDVAKVARDDVNFSAEEDGIVQPPMDERAYPITLDPPRSTQIKHLLTPFFSPQSIEKRYPEICELVTQLVDDFIEKGECCFTEDLGMPLTGIMTMRMAGFAESQWLEYTRMLHNLVYMKGELEELLGYSALLEVWIVEEIQRQKTDPRPGLTSYLLDLQASNELLDDEMICGIVKLLFAGGLDTTQANLSSTLRYFYLHPELKQLFIERPDLRLTIIEESLRLMAPQQALFRTVVNDIEIGGKQFKKGDRVMMCWGAANRDPAAFENPEDFVPDRKPNRHLTFGVGSHRCLGSSLARYEIKAALEEVLTRLPDYEIDMAKVELAPSVGIVYGYSSVPATFPPGNRVGS